MNFFDSIGRFSFCYHSTNSQRLGLSRSSNYWILHTALMMRFESPGLDRMAIATRALAMEPQMVGNSSIAANDVLPIAEGGVVITHTAPHTAKDGLEIPGAAGVTPVDYDPQWIAEHMVLAFDRDAKKHSTPGLLQKLFRDGACGARHVREFSELADVASAAIAKLDIELLANQVNAYREGFQDWTDGSYCPAATPVMDAMNAACGDDVLAWKPPGAGGTQALLILAPYLEARDRVIRFFQSQLWTAGPVRVSAGLEFHPGKKNSFSFSAGHRIDIISAADLGQSPANGEPGCCLAIAVEPRASIVNTNGAICSP